jgi:hypothetical protein
MPSLQKWKISTVTGSGVFIVGAKDCFLVITLGSSEMKECMCGSCCCYVQYSAYVKRQCMVWGRQHGVQQSWMQLPRNHVLPLYWEVKEQEEIDHRRCMHVFEQESCRSVFCRGKSIHALHSMSCEMYDRGFTRHMTIFSLSILFPTFPFLHIISMFLTTIHIHLHCHVPNDHSVQTATKSSYANNTHVITPNHTTPFR